MQRREQDFVSRCEDNERVLFFQWPRILAGSFWSHLEPVTKLAGQEISIRIVCLVWMLSSLPLRCTCVLFCFFFFQPLTKLKGTKCKICGIYEEDTFRYDTFNEWELCPSDFTPEGTYTHAKEKDFNATFLCHGCSQLGAGELLQLKQNY